MKGLRCRANGARVLRVRYVKGCVYGTYYVK
jgi:hypothetical protein